MAEQQVTFTVKAVVPGSSTLNRMDFLCETIRQELDAEGVQVVGQVSWYDTRCDEPEGDE